VFEAVAGWQKAVADFGGSPSFHDAELKSIELSGDGKIALRLETVAGVSPQGTQRRAIFVFTFFDMQSINLDSWFDRNVIFDFTCRTSSAGGLEFDIDGSVGVSGSIVCGRAAVVAE